MSAPVKLVAPAAFCKETGLSKPVFYTLLKQMREAGVVAKTQNKIDMNCQWMVSYLERSRRVQSHSERLEAETPTDHQIAADAELSPSDRPSLNDLLYEKELEGVNKLKIDNAIKSKKVVAKKIVVAMIEKIDDAMNKVIMDGESSFVPQLIQKSRRGADPRTEWEHSEEDVKKFWRKEIGKILKPVKPFLKRVLRQFMDDK